MKLSDRNKQIITFLGLFVFSIIIISIPIILKIDPLQIVLFFIGYFIFTLILSFISKKLNSKIFNKIELILTAPFGVIYLVLGLIVPFGGLFFNTIILFLMTFGIPFLLLNGLDHIFDFGLKKATMVFISLTFASISSVYISKHILGFILKWSPITMDTYDEKPFRKDLKDLTALFYQKNNVNFCIYLFYFIYLLFTAFSKIQYGKPIFNVEIDLAVLQSFLVFIAFSNMVTKSKDVNLAIDKILVLYFKIAFKDIINKKKEETENQELDSNNEKVEK